MNYYIDEKGDLYFLDKSIHENLTQNEVNVLKHILSGKSAREIGECLCKSSRTVEDYILSIRNKMHCKNKGEIISKSLNLGLLKCNLN